MEINQITQIGLALVLVLALIGILFWLLQRFGAGGGGRGRRGHRLGVLEFAFVDKKRRLVLIRRDNVEHLLLIGGPQDVVVESGIGATREPAHDEPRLEAAPRAPDVGLAPVPPPVDRVGPPPRRPEPAPPRRLEPQLRPTPRESAPEPQLSPDLPPERMEPAPEARPGRPDDRYEMPAPEDDRIDTRQPPLDEDFEPAPPPRDHDDAYEDDRLWPEDDRPRRVPPQRRWPEAPEPDPDRRPVRDDIEDDRFGRRRPLPDDDGDYPRRRPYADRHEPREPDRPDPRDVDRRADPGSIRPREER